MTTILSAQELAYMRAAQQAALPDTCTVSRPTTAVTDTGGVTRGFAPVASYPCRLHVQRAGESVLSDRSAHQAVLVVTLPHNADVRPTDRIVIGARVFEVTGYASGSWETARRVTVSEVT